MDLITLELTLVAALRSTTGLKVARTAIPGEPDKFWVTMPQNDRTNYNKFCASVLRLESPTQVRYLVFRNGRNKRPDLGANRYDLTRPSSAILGYMDAQGGFQPRAQIHWATDLPAGATEADAAKALFRVIAAEFANGNPA